MPSLTPGNGPIETFGGLLAEFERRTGRKPTSTELAEALDAFGYDPLFVTPRRERDPETSDRWAS
jgi:hypothetical protein